MTTLTQQIEVIHPQALHAIIAAVNHKSWGRRVTRRYLVIKGVPFGLYRLARQLRVVS